VRKRAASTCVCVFTFVGVGVKKGKYVTVLVTPFFSSGYHALSPGTGGTFVCVCVNKFVCAVFVYVCIRLGMCASMVCVHTYMWLHTYVCADKYVLISPPAPLPPPPSHSLYPSLHRCTSFCVPPKRKKRDDTRKKNETRFSVLRARSLRERMYVHVSD
jgi:hypothetical protein